MTLGPDAKDITQYSQKNDKNNQGIIHKGRLLKGVGMGVHQKEIY